MKKPKRWLEIIERIARKGTLVEVGSWKGATAFKVLDNRPDVRVIMVDPWKSGLVDVGLMKDSDWLESGARMAGVSQVEIERIYESVAARATVYGDRCRIMRMESVVAADLIEPQSVDMVFIDGNHSYAAVKSDIASWLPKVKPGGIIGGHDYDHPRHLGVKPAVLEAFGDEGKIIKGVDRTWWVQL